MSLLSFKYHICEQGLVIQACNSSSSDDWQRSEKSEDSFGKSEFKDNLYNSEIKGKMKGIGGAGEIVQTVKCLPHKN